MSLQKNLYSLVGISLMIFLGYGYYITRTVPSDFPVGKQFMVDENESLRSVSLRLESEHYITSALWFRAWVSSLGGDRHIQLGNYDFDKPYVLGGMVKRFVFENPSKPLIQVTVPEGSTSKEVAKLLHDASPVLSIDVFLKKVSEQNAEGKLFPSTYYLLPSHREGDIVNMMTETFEKKYASSFSWTAISEPLKNLEEVIVLASILEGEAKGETDMQMVAGILLTRLKNGMPLQVDASKVTYSERGLPSLPINNPGLIALGAVLHPSTSPYLFYITGKDGKMYYAKTFDEHKRNIQKYLR